MDLNTAWFLLVGILIIGYAVLDGFDLGVGVLYFFLGKNARDKQILRSTIGPIWDGNEVWLLTGGGALFAAFPVVYSTAFSGFYLALMLVLFGLILRAVSIEYLHRTDSPELTSIMDKMFFIGSFLPALLYGVAMGNVVQGLPLTSDQYYAGTFLQLLNPYALLLGVLGLSAFIMHATNFVLVKTEGEIYQRAQKVAYKFWFAFFILYVLATVYSIFATPKLFASYAANPVLYAVPAVTWIFMLAIPFLQRARKYGFALISSGVSIAGMILILAAGLYPNILPATDPALSLNIYNASSSQLTLKTMLIIALVGMPVVLFYTTYVYRVFKGKVGLEEEGY